MNLWESIAGWFRKPKRPMKRIGICVGHSRIGDSGAVSTGGVSEWTYNKEVADQLESILKRRGFAPILIAHYPRQTYGAAMSWVAGHLRSQQADIAVELHFNSAGPDAEGYEYLFADASGRSLKLAKCFVDAHSRNFPEQPSRGARGRHRSQRGSSFLWGTHCPAVIAEPFFGSNADEWATYRHATEALAETYADAIEEYFKQ